MKKEKEVVKHKITHYLKNGEIRDSMEGYKVPVNEDTKLFYQIVASATTKDKTA